MNSFSRRRKGREGNDPPDVDNDDDRGGDTRRDRNRATVGQGAIPWAAD